MKVRSAALLALTLVFALTVGQAQHATAPQNESIRQEEMRADLFFLASDAMRGRLTGTPENALTAEFLKARFERLGLKPAGPEGSYYHPFNLTVARLGTGNSLEIATGESTTVRFAVGQDHYPQRFSASGRARGQVVYAGYGISSPAHRHDDYKGDVKGKIVLVLEHEPGERDPASPFDGVVTSEAANLLRKTLAAQEKGAIGILFVQDVHNHPGPVNFEASARNFWPDPPPRVERYSLATWVERIRIPAVTVAPALAAQLVRGTNRTLEDLARDAETAGGLTPVPLPGVQVDLATDVSRHTVSDRNVVALVEGSDPRLKDEWIIICAHYDHDGADGDRVFTGADDDASGTVALLEIAEAYALAARAGQGPRRTILFAAWNSEERGLLGAWAYTEHPLQPLDRTLAVLNMDMIGRNEEVPVGGGARFRGLEIQTAESNANAVNIMGYSRSADLKAQVEAANRGIGLDLKMRYDNNESNLLRRSDQWPFLHRGVPALFFHTGLHPDYHTIYDRPEKINYAKMEKIARLVHQTSWNLAQQDARPRMTN